MTMPLSEVAMMKAIAVFAVLAASPALAADAPNVSPVTIETPPPCTGFCADVFLQVQDQCVWASNGENTPLVLVLTLSSGATMQFMLKSPTSYTAANAPYDNKQCDSLEKMVQNINQHGQGGALASNATLIQQLKACNAEETAAGNANLKKDEYYDTSTRTVLRKSTIGLGGSFKSTETYPVYWVRLKTGATCLAAFHDIKSYTSYPSQTMGSWVVSVTNKVVGATLTPAAITLPASGGPSPSPDVPTSALKLEYRHDSLFENSQIAVTIAPGSGVFAPSAVFHVLADGKDVGQFNGNDTGVAAVGLSTLFGADLAGLASVQQISVTGNSPRNMTLFTANLQQTSAALAAMKAFADAM
jgi:hypothetical protein